MPARTPLGPQKEIGGRRSLATDGFHDLDSISGTYTTIWEVVSPVLLVSSEW
jgi:hypothetical protein